MKVIIPVWAIDSETISLTENAVESFKGHNIVIVDNGSMVGAGRLREMADLYIRFKFNFGYAVAVNVGLRQFLGETVAVANNDIRVSPDWAMVADEIIKLKDVGSVHFRMIPYEQPFSYGNDIWTSGKERWCSSSFFVVRAVQTFDENYLNSYEDYDYWYRFRQKGFKTAYTNKACYQHLDSSTQVKVLDRDQNDKRNYEYYKFKHGEYPDIQFEKAYPEQMNIPWKPFP